MFRNTIMPRFRQGISGKKCGFGGEKQMSQGPAGMDLVRPMNTVHLKTCLTCQAADGHPVYAGWKCAAGSHIRSGNPPAPPGGSLSSTCAASHDRGMRRPHIRIPPSGWTPGSPAIPHFWAARAELGFPRIRRRGQAVPAGLRTPESAGRGTARAEGLPSGCGRRCGGEHRSPLNFRSPVPDRRCGCRWRTHRSILWSPGSITGPEMQGKQWTKRAVKKYTFLCL
ncbi:MAG: hypothetical protein JWM59_2706 [Verrucomicrobiales bacterium]|nr:hypothetical protein [Verrucomicrobiales bacterium]